MFAWIAQNWGTLLIGLAVAGLVAFAVAKLARDRKKGKSSCGCNCEHCPKSGGGRADGKAGDCGSGIVK
ncbi:MAG: FeoB-associated Cys-rich membrane protein [Clostridiales bacterium]|jgi:hypothetical protein|nr:FeoB-associated Cys-rich membrane protein [Clostridiales bacterium]